MAGEGYQVTKSLAAEKAAIRRVTAEVQKLKARKNADTTAIRSWRFKYMAWKKRVVITDRKKSEDEVMIQTRTIRAYNREAEKVATWHSLTADDQTLSKKSQKIGLLRRHLAHLRSFEISGIADTVASAEAKLDQYEQAIEEMKQAKERHGEQEAAYEDSEKLQQKYKQDLAAYEDAEKVAQQVQGKNEDLQAQYQRDLKAYQQRVEQYKEYQKAVDKFDDDMDTFLVAEDKREELVDKLQGVATRLNQNDYSIKIADVDEEKLELRPTSSGIDTVAGAIMTSYKNYRSMGLDRFFELGLIATLGNPDLSTAVAEANGGDLDGAQREISRVLSVALEQYLADKNKEQELVQARQAGEPVEPREPEHVDRPVEPEKPQLVAVEHAKKPVKPEEVAKPKKVEPIELPAFTEIIGYTPSLPESMVDEKLVEELDTYATGSYDHTRGHFEELNAIAEKIGAECPKIAIVDSSFSTSGLISSVSELEGAISSFGGQRNSATGAAIIRDFKSAESELKVASNFSDFESASARFDTLSTRLLAWISTSWWQEGGKPSGDAHPWKPQGGTRRLVTKKKK